MFGKLAIDDVTKELYISDRGCMMVLKVGLLDNSLVSSLGELIRFSLTNLIRILIPDGLAGCPQLFCPGQSLPN